MRKDAEFGAFFPYKVDYFAKKTALFKSS